MRNNIIRGLNSVRATYTDEDVDLAVVRATRIKANDPAKFAFTVGRNLGIDLNRRAASAEERRLKKLVADEIAHSKQERMKSARTELIRLCGKVVDLKPQLANRIMLLLDIEIHGMSTEDVQSKYGLKRDAVYKSRQRAAEDIWPEASPNLRAEILRLRNR